MTIVLKQVDQASTRLLRQSVLRPHQSIEELAGEERADATSFGAVEEETGEVVATATLQSEPMPFMPPDALPYQGLAAWRLRGMATAPARRREGLGRALLAVVIQFVADSGGGLLWCAARKPAIPLYHDAEFAAYGSEWMEEHIGPHVHMWRVVLPAPS